MLDNLNNNSLEYDIIDAKNIREFIQNDDFDMLEKYIPKYAIELLHNDYNIYNKTLNKLQNLINENNNKYKELEDWNTKLNDACKKANEIFEEACITFDSIKASKSLENISKALENTSTDDASKVLEASSVDTSKDNIKASNDANLKDSKIETFENIVNNNIKNKILSELKDIINQLNEASIKLNDTMTSSRNVYNSTIEYINNNFDDNQLNEYEQNNKNIINNMTKVLSTIPNIINDCIKSMNYNKSKIYKYEYNNLKNELDKLNVALENADKKDKKEIFMKRNTVREACKQKEKELRLFNKRNNL